MNYKLLKDLPLAEAGTEVELYKDSEGIYSKIWLPLDLKYAREIATINPLDINEWLEPIVEKKTYDDLMVCDKIYFIDSYWEVDTEKFTTNNCRAETFLTREEAEDEHKRREWAVRKNKFFPKEWELYYTQWRDTGDIEKFKMTNDYIDNFIINSWLAFRSESECQDAIDNHDIIRLFYDVR